MTAVWTSDVDEGTGTGRAPVGESGNPSLNLVLVEHSVDHTDPYGRQICRETSIVHKGDNAAPGNYWRLPD